VEADRYDLLLQVFKNESLNKEIMKRISLSGLIVVLAMIMIPATYCSQLFAQKMNLHPYPKTNKPKIHPYASLLKQESTFEHAQKNKGDYRKLLVILVDFQEDEDPLSTGNGKFQLEEDADYLFSIGKPPHDREYFEANLEAMRHYYSAASAGYYDLIYDVWPKDKAAYTLSQPMSYYNPPNANSELFVSKMEEYFKEAFETADNDDPQIEFGQYAHYMIIHAGSDWQHDYAGDSPVDIPSFFIRVGDGKQAEVDNGDHEIFHACNVPATISQDFDFIEEGGKITHTGYGALNAVLFHEFGHSLGLVDLYNVYSFSPMVGMFDIMDSGGSGISKFDLGNENDDYVLVEGALPTLPGAFSRSLLFEDIFRSNGLYKDISEYEALSTIEIASSSMIQDEYVKPNIIRYQISPDEYYLIENRNLDPDGDGFTSVYATLNGRVILHPVAFGDPTNKPTYEYDYLLPSFLDGDLNVKGGGLLVWYVNEKVLYQEGSVLDDGSFWSNFENNTVNTSFNRPSVMVLEADGIRDLGEYYSQYWTGTPYEYFHARKPSFGAYGEFIEWSDEEWRPRLSAQSEPALVNEAGLGGQFFFDNISDPAPIMTCTLESSLWDTTKSIFVESSPLAAQPISTDFCELSMPFFGSGGLRLFCDLGGEWIEMIEPVQIEEWDFDFPAISIENSITGDKEIVGVKDNTLRFMLVSTIGVAENAIEFSGTLAQPIEIDNNLYTHVGDTIFRVSDYIIADSTSVEDLKNITGFSGTIIALSERNFHLLDAQQLSLIDAIELPEIFGEYEPIVCKSDKAVEVFLTANSGNIYRYTYALDRMDTTNLNLIFRNPSSYLPSQPALLADSSKDLRLFFGLGNNAYLINYNGYLNQGFPRCLDRITISPNGNSKVVRFEDETILYLQVNSQGYVAISDRGELRPEFSMLVPYHSEIEHPAWTDILYYDAVNSRLLWYYTIANPGKNIGYIHSIDGLDENPILWNGYQNSGSGVVFGSIQAEPGTTHEAFNAFVFPSPVSKEYYHLRVENAPADIEINIYDISGLKVQSHKLQHEPRLDLELSSKKLSSGVYLVNVTSGNKIKSFKFAVEK